MPFPMLLLCLLFSVNAFANTLKPQDYDPLLQEHQLPGISLVVVDNYQQVFSYVSGYTDNLSKEKIDHNTAFNAASISKPVVATLAVMLAEQGKLDLDKAVSSYLKNWTLPKSAFKQQITLRHLLSHTAGTSQSGYKSQYLGDEIKSTINILENYKNQPISTLFEPGTNWQYSGGGFLIAQLALEDITGQSLAQLANHMLFTPLNMKNTSFYQHGDKQFPTNLAKAHDNQQQVIKTGIPICPQAACGLWTNATDMALLAIEMQKALSGQQTKVISNKVAKALIEIQTTQLSGGWGVGWMRNRALANLDWFSHDGYNHGTGGLVMASTEGGRGIFIFANGAYQARVRVMQNLLTDISQKLNWQQHIQPSKEQLTPDFIQQISGQYQNLTPHFFSPFARQVSIKQQGEKLLLVNGKSKTYNLIHVGDNKFRADELVNSSLGFEQAEDGQLYLTLEQQNLRSKALIKQP